MKGARAESGARGKAIAISDGEIYGETGPVSSPPESLSLPTLSKAGWLSGPGHLCCL